MQKENSKEEDEEASIVQNNGDDELPKADRPTELSDEDLERFSILF